MTNAGDTQTDDDLSPSLLRAARSGTTVGLSQLGYAAASFVLSLAIAATFGAAGPTDAYFMASSTAELLAKILLGGALVSVALPVFVEFLALGDAARAWRLFSSLFSLALIAFLLLGGVLELFARPLVDLLAPGFGDDTRALTVTLLRVVFPAYLFSFLTDLATVPLHAHRRFGLPAASRLITPALTLLILLALVSRIGIATLALGTLAGAALQAVLLLAALRRLRHHVSFRAPFRNPDTWRVLRRTLPFVLSILAAHGAGAVYRILVSEAPEGSLASLKFAEKIFQMANVLFLGTITQIAFPVFARAAATGTPDDIRARLREAARAVAFFAIPLTVSLVLLRTPLVRTLYERGAFTAEATAATALLVPLYAFGLLGNGWSSLLGHLTLAVQETKAAVAVNVALQALAATLFVLLVPTLGVPGLALVSGLGPFFLTVLYLVALRRRVPGLPRALLNRQIFPLALAGAACAVTVGISRHAGQLLAPGMARDLASLATGGALGTAAYLAVAWLLGVPEVQTLRALVGQVIRRLPLLRRA